MTDRFSRLLDILERNSNCSSPINVCTAFKVKVKVKWGESSMRGRGSIKTNKEVNKTRNPFFLLPSFYQACLVSPSIYHLYLFSVAVVSGKFRVWWAEGQLPGIDFDRSWVARFLIDSRSLAPFENSLQRGYSGVRICICACLDWSERR